MWTKHPIIVALAACVDKSLCHIAVWCKLAAIKICFSYISAAAGTWTYILPRKHHCNSRPCTPECRAVFCQPESLVSPPSSEDADGALSTRLWWGELMKKYNAMAGGQQCLWGVSSRLTAFPARWFIHFQSQQAPAEEVTTRPRRSAELFQARGVLDAGRRNDTVWCLKFNSWKTVQTFPGDASQTRLSSDKEAVLFTTVHSFRLYTPVTFYCSHSAIALVKTRQHAEYVEKFRGASYSSAGAGDAGLQRREFLLWLN